MHARAHAEIAGALGGPALRLAGLSADGGSRAPIRHAEGPTLPTATRRHALPALLFTIVTHVALLAVMAGPRPASVSAAARAPASATIVYLHTAVAPAGQDAPGHITSTTADGSAPATTPRDEPRPRATTSPTPPTEAPPRVNTGPSFHPTDDLDIAPVPRSAPDERALDGAHRSGLPIRVRVFLRADGIVWNVELLSYAPGDRDTAKRVARMFRETAFVPGRRAGRDVASFMDIEIRLDPLLDARRVLAP